MNDIEYKTTTFNGQECRCYADGSVAVAHQISGKFKRSFGYDQGGGYRNRSIGGRKALHHRLTAEAWLDTFSPELQVDHINGVKTDNRPENLRMVTNLENNQGFKTKRKGCSSKYRGVSWSKSARKWYAKCNVNEKYRHIGQYDNEEDAARAYDSYVYARGFKAEALNFPINTNTK